MSGERRAAAIGMGHTCLIAIFAGGRELHDLVMKPWKACRKRAIEAQGASFGSATGAQSEKVSITCCDGG